MYNASGIRAVNAYRNLSVETQVAGATPHQLIALLFDGLRQALAAAEVALLQGNIPAKGTQIGKAVRLLEEGLKGGLDDARGGELAATLRSLYDYCIERLTFANLRNDARSIAEVAALIAPLAQGWREIEGSPAASIR